MNNINYKRLVKEGWLEIDEYDGDLSELILNLESNLKTEFECKTTILMPQRYSKKFQNTLSGVFGLERFPYHTDGAQYRIPPQFIILRGLYKSSTATKLLDLSQFINSDIYEKVFEGDIYITTLNKSLLYTTIANKILVPGSTIYRYNHVIMKKISKVKLRAFEMLLATINSSCHHEIKWTKNRTIVIDNWRFVHARDRVTPNDLNKRVIERVYLFNKNYYE